MPIYEYQCKSCNERCEIIQKVNDPHASECPHCHAPELKRLVSAAGFRLKGSGWYVTDFKDKGKGKDKDKSKDKETPKTEKREEKPKADKKESKTEE